MTLIYSNCKLCGNAPSVPKEVCGHYQVICLTCGIEVTRLSRKKSWQIWNELMIGGVVKCEDPVKA